MKSKQLFLIVAIIGLILMSFSAHKFYTSICKIDYNAPKKRLEITARIFIDDLNLAISEKYNRKSNLVSDNETTEDVNFLKKYISEKLIVTVNGKSVPIRFLSKEVEDNVLICYLNSNAIAKIKTLEIQNTLLTEMFEEQQNIVQLNINSKKQTLLLSTSTTKGMLK
jgi:hypothetical protein